MEERIISLEKHISNLQKERSDREWFGDYEAADFLQKLIDSSVEERDKGEVYYPNF